MRELTHVELINKCAEIVLDYPVIYSATDRRDQIVKVLRRQLAKAIRESFCDGCGAPMAPTDEMCSQCG